MEFVESRSLKIKIDNYTGPLEVLLDLAKSQKVNLENISTYMILCTRGGIYILVA